MLSVNKVTLLGNVGQEPNLIPMKSGKNMLYLNVATSSTWKNKDPNSKQKIEKTEWHKVCIFGEELVEILKNIIKKGTKVYIEGKISTRDWKSPDGNTNYVTEIVVSDRSHTVIKLDKDRSSSEGNYNYQKTVNDYNRKQTTSFCNSLDDFADDEAPF